MIKSDLYPELEPIAKKSSYEQIFKVLYLVSSFRYATFKQLHSINHRVATKRNLVALTELGYLKQIKDLQCYHSTTKTWEVLKKEGYNTEIIHKTLEAEAPSHELDITNALLNIYKEKDFYAVFYPHFITLIPDACIIYKNETAYKIVFLEVENPKFDWDNYIEGKKRHYGYLAKDENLYSKWWLRWSELLKLPYCTREEFCFDVQILQK